MKTTIYKALLLITSILLAIGITATATTTDTVTSISPINGSLAGKTLITIKGNGFKGSTLSIQFGTVGVLSANVNVKSDSVLTVTNPAVASVQSVKVKVIIGGKNYYPPNEFAYKLPVITAIQPNSSTVKGKEVVTITGKYLSGASYVKFGTAGDTALSVSDTMLTVMNPAHVSDTVNVQVEVQGVYSATSTVAKFIYENDQPDSLYTISLHNLTGLADKYKVYILGYSTNSKKMLTVTDSIGSFTPMPTSPDSGYVQSYELGKDITKIKVSSLNPIVGARIYFFVADTTHSYTDSSNQTANHNLGFKYSASGANVYQVNNPPQSGYPQYSYLEATFEKNQGLYIDISTVDGFFFPLSLIAQDSSGAELSRIGQPGSVSADQIVTAYKPFMKTLQNGGESTHNYDSLSYKINNDLTALLNPGLYLENNESMLETVFDSALNVMFTDANMKIWQNGDSTFQAYYDVTPVANHPFPKTNNKHDALRFTSTGSDTLYLYNPVGFSVVSYADTVTNTRNPIMGKIKDSVLTFKTPLPLNVGLDIGMYVNSGGGSIDGLTKILKINTKNNTIVSINLDSCTNYSSYFQYKFAKAPTNYYYSSGQMTFAGIGLFADGVFRYDSINNQTVVNGIENQISTALNRGVGVLTFDDSTSQGHSTKNWAIETGWYPMGEPQNYFSYFMHTAKTPAGTHIFSLPADSVTSARGVYMSMAYGFAYDENPNPLGGYKGPQVPSEFSGTYPKGTIQLKFVLGPWKTH